MSKLALGTVQFGIDYGINNQRGMVPIDEVFTILDEAVNSSIDTIDTASTYGESELIIGKYLKENKNSFNVVSKVPKCERSQIPSNLEKTLIKLNLTSLYGYIFHDFKSYLDDPSSLDVILELKRSGKIKKAGFSLYYTNELDRLLENGIEFDLVQVPYNVFDQRFAGYFKKLKKLGVEIHVRSIFLQGLVFKDPVALTGDFEKIKEKISYLNNLALINNVSIADICLAYGITNNFIDKVIFGVDSFGQLKEIISSSKKSEKLIDILKDLSFLKVDDEEIIIPSKWNKAMSAGASK